VKITNIVAIRANAPILALFNSSARERVAEREREIENNIRTGCECSSGGGGGGGQLNAKHASLVHRCNDVWKSLGDFFHRANINYTLAAFIYGYLA